MANSIPLTFRCAPLPLGYRADPETFKNDIVARMYAESTEAISFFASGSIAPSSNVGPWLKNGQEWWVWSDSLATYVPMPVAASSLKWIAQNAAPDPSVYIFWIYLDTNGKGQAIKTYYSGAWHDIYEDTFAGIATSIASGDAATLASAHSYTDSAISASAFRSYPARAESPGTQTVNTAGVPVKVTLNTADINPGGSFDTASSEYAAPVAGLYQVSVLSQFDNSTGQASTMEVGIGCNVNNFSVPGGDLDSTPSPNGSRWSPGFSYILSLNAGDRVSVSAFAQDGVGSGNITVTSVIASFFRIAST